MNETTPRKMPYKNKLFCMTYGKFIEIKNQQESLLQFSHIELR